MGYLGSRASPAAVIDNTDANPYGNGFWTITYDPAVLALGSAACEMYHLTLRGPTGSSVDVYVNQTFYDTTERGDKNSWDSNHPLFIPGGQSLILYWNSAGTPAPKVTIWLRTPEA